MSVSVDQNVLGRFKRLKASGRLAHAYLFSGPVQTGKKQTALAVAQLVNCFQIPGPCGTCASCLKIEHNSHPDVHFLGQTDEDAIKIDEVRHMLGRISLRAYEAVTKVFIMRDIERMTTEAANALLKTLEEPAPNTLMILTTASPEACLDTIKSRCQTVKFFSNQDVLPPDRERVLDVFLSKSGQEDYLKNLSGDRKQAGQAMLVLLSFLRDAMLYKAGATSGLLYRSRMGDVKSLSQRPIEELCDLNRQIVRVKSLVDENLNVKMALSLLKERVWGN